MIKLNDLHLKIDYTDEDVKKNIANKLNIDKCDVLGYEVLKRSYDCRKKPDIKMVLNVAVQLKNEKNILLSGKAIQEYVEPNIDVVICGNKNYTTRPIIVGSGPAGLFCALVLAYNNVKPIILERGEPVEKRTKKVNAMFELGIIDTESNIQFGEGGAGTFSDGKLNSGITSEYIRFVLKEFVKFGAKDDILTDAKPHIGTDYLAIIVANIRAFLLSRGVEYIFGAKVDDFVINKGKCVGVQYIKNGVRNEILSDATILAIGHSSRDTIRKLYSLGLEIKPKIFAIGVRIEHLQNEVDYNAYGKNRGKLPAADYKMAVKTASGRNLYTFCMCPGGEVVAAASEKGGICTNGMSYNARNAKNANSALLVNVTPNDYNGVLGGIELQQNLEKKAFDVSNSYCAPCQSVGSFLFNKPNRVTKIKPSYKPSVVEADLKSILPAYVVKTLCDGIKLFSNKARFFKDENAVLTGVETRSSSPVTIVRDDDFESNIKGLYPIGEGAGYAGGITSSAVDGIKAAFAILKKID